VCTHFLTVFVSFLTGWSWVLPIDPLASSSSSQSPWEKVENGKVPTREGKIVNAPKRRRGGSKTPNKSDTPYGRANSDYSDNDSDYSDGDTRKKRRK